MKHLILILGLLIFSATIQAVENQTDKQLMTGQQMLPYAAEQTVQTFSKTVHGGVLHIVAKAADNATQIKLIQAYLLKLAAQFRNGDFSMTEALHGSRMPGLAQLKTAKPDEIKFEYHALANGGQIHFSTEYPQFVGALHEWIDAQNTEHGNAVIPGHSQHHGSITQ